MNKKIKALIAISIIALVITIIYYQLGGGQPLVFEIETKDKLVIYGSPIKGKYNDPEIEALFVSARDHVLKNPKDLLVIVNYEMAAKDSVKQFIGYSSTQNYETMNIVMEEVTFVKTVITSHNLVMPNPMKVREEAASFAAKKGLKLDDFSLEIYRNEGELEVLFPTKAD